MARGESRLTHQVGNDIWVLPPGLITSSLGNVYIGDHGNNRVRKVTVSSGIITTIAGTGASSFSGDNGPATSATLARPAGVTTDSSGTTAHFVIHFFHLLGLTPHSSGNFYIADMDNNRIRKVTVSTGIITTIAGIGTYSFSGDNGPATSAAIQRPQGVAVDAAGMTHALISPLISSVTYPLR